MANDKFMHKCMEQTSSKMLYPLHPNISMHILHTVLYTFSKELTKRIVQQSKAS